MGCCPCWKSSGGATNEYTPIPREQTHGVEVAGGVQPVETGSAQYYQSVIDVAQRKFISSGGPRLLPRDNRADELRNKIKQVDLPSEPFSPPQKKSYLQWGSNHTSQQIVDILSAPISVNNYDNVADELAEMAAAHTLTMNADDSTNSTVASFRQVNLV